MCIIKINTTNEAQNLVIGMDFTASVGPVSEFS